MSRLWNTLPQYVITKKKIDIGESDPDAIIKTLENRYRKERLNTIDGLKIERDDSWIHIRKSNTEPIIRVMAEAPYRESSSSLCDSFVEEIKRLS